MPHYAALVHVSIAAYFSCVMSTSAGTNFFVLQVHWMVSISYAILVKCRFVLSGKLVATRMCTSCTSEGLPITVNRNGDCDGEALISVDAQEAVLRLASRKENGDHRHF